MARYVSPLGSPKTAGFRLASRPARLEGGVLGLLSNGKPNANRLLRGLGEEFATHHGIKDILWLDKTQQAQGPGYPSPSWMFDVLSSGTVAVLTASGD